MNIDRSKMVNKTGVATNCLMYMLIRLATQNSFNNESIDNTKKSFTIMDSINRSLSQVEK